eukprot:7119111-Prymnesium_polylepis.1
MGPYFTLGCTAALALRAGRVGRCTNHNEHSWDLAVGVLQFAQSDQCLASPELQRPTPRCKDQAFCVDVDTL